MPSTTFTGRAAAAFLALAGAGHALAGATVQVGPSGLTFASAAVQCGLDAAGGRRPVVDAGLYMPRRNSTATVALDGAWVASVTTAAPSVRVWLADGTHIVSISPNRKIADAYTFVVPTGLCSLPDTSGNTFSADGSLEYAASGKSYATVRPGCALNGSTGLTQPYVNLFDNGGYLLNVSVNGVPLTQLSATRPHTPVFLGPGINVISAANASLSTDYYVRDGGDGRCVLAP